MVATTIACALACLVLVDGERRGNDVQRWVAKIAASCAFVATALLAGGGDDYARWVVIGLVLGLVGDVALLARRGFVAGLAAFLLGHLAYVIAFATRTPFTAWGHEVGMLAAIPPAVGVIVLLPMWDRLGRLRAAVIAYVLAIVVMVVGALAAWRAGQVRWIAALGAALFFASDIAVARERFVGKRFANKAWGLPAYYAAQLLIAWSIG